MAKKAQSTLINMLLSLTVVAVVAAAVLALVSGVTAEPIANAKQAKKEAAIKAVLPEFATLEDKEAEAHKCHLAYDANGKMVGIAVESYSDKAFGGRLSVMIGFDAEGSIYGYQVVESAETPGLGAKADEWFQKGGKGDVIGKNPSTNNLTASKDGGEVDAISGSTITTRAFCDAIANAYQAYLAVKD